MVYAGKGKRGFTVLDPNTGSSYELAAKGDLSVLGYGDLSSSCMDMVVTNPTDPSDPLACDKIKITNSGTDVTINNENDQEVVVYYSVHENGQQTKIGNLLVDANTSIDFSEKVPGNGKIVFSMGSDNIQDSTVVTGAYCAVKTGTEIVDAGERIETIQVYEGKSYDARDLSWFVFKERQRLQDLNGNTVENSDKGVSLEDLTTIADESNMQVDIKTGRIGYTDALVWFKIEGGMPTAPQLLNSGLPNLSSATGTINGNIPAGTRMGFVLVGDVAAKNPIVQNPNAQLRFEGTRLQYSTDNGSTWNTIPPYQLVYSIKDWNRNQHEGVVAGISDHPTKAGEKVLTVVFEDIAGGYGDLDYEDMHCTVYMKGVTKLKTKVIKETKEIDVYTEIPCGNCEVTIEGEKNELECPGDAYRYKLSNGSADNQNYHVWMPDFFVQGETARMTFEKDAFIDIKKDGSQARLYGFATVTGSGGSSMGARYLVDATFNKASDKTGPKVTLPSQTPDVVADWKYFVLDGTKSTITRVGGGTQVIKLTQMPANEQFGLQVGISANGQNANFGAAAWFFWEEVGTGRKGTGDFTLNMDNLCPDDLECPDDAYRHVLSNAVSDGAHGGNHDHSIWMPNLFVQGQKAIFTFDKDAYMDITKDDSQAHIYGYATVTKGGGASMGARYLVDVKFNRATNDMMPKKELKAGYQPDEVTKNWKFFEMDETQATMTNTSTGQVVKLTHKPADKKMGLQVGLTANGKNVKFGASAWFYWEEVGTGRKGHGDFNLDLENLCPGQPLPDLCEPPIEVIYVLDNSGSMQWEYPKTDADGKTISRFRAAQDALIFANKTLAKQGVQSRAALVTFGRGKSSQVISGFTKDYQKLNETVENLGSPYGYTPMPKGMRNAKDLLKTRDPNKIPVVVLLTDGVPNIDLNGKTYSAKKAEVIDIFNEATQTFRTKEEVATMGGANSSNPGTYHGKPLSEVMGLMEEMKSEVGDLLIYGLGVQKDLNSNKGEFNDDILEYGAHITGALYHTVDNADDMVTAMADILLDATCKPHNPPTDPTCEILLNGTPLTDSTQWNSVWNGQSDKVTVTLKNITEPVTYNWKLTFPTDPSVPAVEASGTFDQDGTYEITIPIPAQGQWGNVSSDGTGVFKANVNFNISTPCGDQTWEHIYYAPDEADLQVVKTVDETNVTVGDTINYTITVTNNGPRTAGDDSNTSKAVKLTDVIPSGLNVVSVTGGTFTPSGVLYLGEMNIYTSKTVTVQAVTTTTGDITNTATVSVASPTDPDLSNNTSSVTTTVVAKPVADLQITGTGPATAFQNAEATYTFTVTNNGPDNADQISITNGLPAGMTLISSTESAITSLASGASANFEVKVKLETTGDLQITSTVSSSIEDPNPANNVATVNTTVNIDFSGESCFPIFPDRYIPGFNKSGQAVFGNAFAALGQPERTNATGTYVSLGFGGEITLIYGAPVANGDGNDIRIAEASPDGSNCTNNPEKAEVFASTNGIDWVPLGTACGANSEFDLGILHEASFIRIIDVSDANDFTDATADGFDVDGIACLNGTTPTNPPADLKGCEGRQLVSFTPGTKQDGSALDAGNDPNQALGDVGDINDPTQSVSLGFGGEIIIKFDFALFNSSGDDISIVEYSPEFDCNNNKERVKVYASKFGNDWTLLGEGCMDADYDLGTLNWAQYFRIVDVSSPSDFVDADANGFDLDAIKCTGGGGAIFFDAKHTDIGDEDVKVGPNPAEDHVDVNLTDLFSGSKHIVIKKVTVTLTDLKGRQLGTQTLDLNSGSRKLRFGLTPGSGREVVIIKVNTLYNDSNGHEKESILTKKILK